MVENQIALTVLCAVSNENRSLIGSRRDRCISEIETLGFPSRGHRAPLTPALVDEHLNSVQCVNRMAKCKRLPGDLGHFVRREAFFEVPLWFPTIQAVAPLRLHPTETIL